MKMIVLLTVAIGMSGCAFGSDGDAATLYRNPIVGDPNERVHVATFDSKDGKSYNWTNCTTFADLVMQQEGVEVRYWCEAGRFRP
jgi:hypothetical protein